LPAGETDQPNCKGVLCTTWPSAGAKKHQGEFQVCREKAHGGSGYHRGGSLLLDMNLFQGLNSRGSEGERGRLLRQMRYAKTKKKSWPLFKKNVCKGSLSIIGGGDKPKKLP